MKRLLPLIAFLCITAANAQINLKSGNTENGIIKSGENGMNLGYDFSKSEARFIYGSTKSQMIPYYKMKNGELHKMQSGLNTSQIDLTQIVDTIYNLPFSGNNFKIILPITDGANSLVSGGEYNPGIGFYYERIHNRDENKSNRRYGFIRLGYEVKQNKYGRISQDDSLFIEKKSTHTFNVTPGFNWILSPVKEKENLVVALSMALQYNINPVLDMRTKEYVIYDTLTANGSIQRTENAYPNVEEDYFSLLPKLDFAWTPFFIRNKENVEDGPRIGFLSSLSSKYNFNTQKFAWNFSIGPSLHPKWSTTNIISTIQFEFIDIGNSTGNKEFEDIFSIVLYIGIPIIFK